MTDTRDPSASDGRWARAAVDEPATPAATVVVLRDATGGPEVLMLRRRRGGAFSGMWVFPGGRVDPGDLAAAGVTASEVAAGVGGSDTEITAARYAAVREAEEEATLHLDADDLVVHSHWQPPLEASRRFSTWFFVVGVDTATAVTVDRAEVHDHRWITPALAMEERDAGTFPLAAPTWMTLWQIAPHPDVASVLAATRRATPLRFATSLVRGEGKLTFVWPGDVAYEDGELERPGHRRRLTAPDDGPWLAQMSEPGPSVPTGSEGSGAACDTAAGRG
jgi:8-oxo-dGTP pyrophosphatase MutT (NUDIX family)